MFSSPRYFTFHKSGNAQSLPITVLPNSRANIPCALPPPVLVAGDFFMHEASLCVR